MLKDWPVPRGGWDLASLTELFASDPEELGDVDVDIAGETGVLRVTLKERGDLNVLVVSSSEQLLFSVLIVAADEIPNREGFERELLTTHKLIPLSTFGLTRISGAEWYELFGSLSAASSAEQVIEEASVLAGNAVDAAEWVSEWIAAGGDLEKMGEAE